jgi:hypothetical protein
MMFARNASQAIESINFKLVSFQLHEFAFDSATEGQIIAQITKQRAKLTQAKTNEINELDGKKSVIISGYNKSINEIINRSKS